MQMPAVFASPASGAQQFPACATAPGEQLGALALVHYQLQLHWPAQCLWLAGSYAALQPHAGVLPPAVHFAIQLKVCGVYGQHTHLHALHVASGQY